MENQDPQTEQQQLSERETPPQEKTCAHCGKTKPLSHYKRRTGKGSGRSSRRGVCRACRKKAAKGNKSLPVPEEAAAPSPAEPILPPKTLVRRPLPAPPPKPVGPDASQLRPTREGIIRMRGHTDKGRRWYQETDLETATVLVREYAAVVVNPHTIRRLYSNKKFRHYILTRDMYTCHFCGEYGDTIDHLLPRAKGGHTTPVNCVCACSICNQNKASLSLEEFMEGAAGEGE